MPAWALIMLFIIYFFLEPGVIIAPWLFVLGMKYGKSWLKTLALIWYFVGLGFVLLRWHGGWIFEPQTINLGHHFK